MIRTIVLASFALAACDQKGAPPPVTTVSTAPALEDRVAELEKTVAELQRVSAVRAAYLKPNAPGWTLIDTNGGMPLRLGLDEVTPRANGSEIILQIGNPSSVTLRECSIDLGWGETKSDGTTVRDTWHHNRVRIPEAIPAGGFAQPKLPLADIAPDKLGAVTVGNVDCLRWQKADGT